VEFVDLLTMACLGPHRSTDRWRGVSYSRRLARLLYPAATGLVPVSTPRPPVVRMGPGAATIGPVASLEFERVEALELLGMVLAHLSIAETRSELSPRVPLLMGIRDKLAEALREEQ
jgi:hypothetical protein